MRLLNLIPSLDPEHGGPVTGLLHYTAALRRLGHEDEVVVTLDGPDDPWVRDFPGRVHAIGPRRWRYGYTTALRPWLEAHARDYDMVLVHGLWQFHTLMAWRTLKPMGVPYAVFVHGMLDPWAHRGKPLKQLKKALYWPFADYRVLRDAATVLYTTRDEADRAPTSMWPYQAHGAVVGYGVTGCADDQQASAAEFTRVHRETAGRRIVLFLGRLHPKKGCDLLIEAFARSGAPQAGMHLVMAGPDPLNLRPRLSRRAEDLGLKRHITWTGMLQGSLKWSALQAAEVFMLPSHQENFGVAVVEALSVGLPVLVSDQVNIWREVVDDGAGFSGADTVDGTTRLLDRWIALGELSRAAMRAQARRCFDAHFAVDAAAQRLVDRLAASLQPATAPA